MHIIYINGQREHLHNSVIYSDLFSSTGAKRGPGGHSHQASSVLIYIIVTALVL